MILEIFGVISFEYTSTWQPQLHSSQEKAAPKSETKFNKLVFGHENSLSKTCYAL
jgi:hypothetical protein